MNRRSFRQSLRRSGGFTMNPSTGQSPSLGYSVSDYGAESVGRVKSRAKTARRVNDYLGQRADLMAPEQRKHLGGWREHGGGKSPTRDYLDVSDVYPQAPHGRSQATMKTVLHNQKAFYDVGGGQEVTNPAYEPDPWAMGRRTQRMSGQNVTHDPGDHLGAVNEFFRSSFGR